MNERLPGSHLLNLAESAPRKHAKPFPKMIVALPVRFHESRKKVEYLIPSIVPVRQDNRLAVAVGIIVTELLYAPARMNSYNSASDPQYS